MNGAMTTPVWWNKIPARTRRWSTRLVIAFVVYSLLGFFVVPAILKWQLVKRLPAITKRTAEIRQVRMNPWTLSLAIRGLALKEPDGSTFASWEEFYANFQLSSLPRWAWTFKEIRLQDFFAGVILKEDGRFNFANMLADAESEAVPKPEPTPPSPAEPGSSVPRLRVFLVTITNGYFGFEDRTRRQPVRTEYRPINLHLTGLTTQPGTGTPYSFRAERDATHSLAWKGDITVEPFSSHGSIEVNGFEPGKYQPYLEDVTTAQVAAGTVDVRMDYWISAGTNGLDLAASNGVVRLAGLEIRDPHAQETVFKLPRLTVQGAGMDLRTRSAKVASIKVEQPEVIARLLADGSMNWQRLLVTNAPAAEPGTNAPPDTPVAPWTATLDRFELAGASVVFEDLTRRSPFTTTLSPIDFSLNEFTTGPDRDARFQFTMKTEAAETISGDGTFSINPVRSAGEVKLGAIRLPKYWPYAEEHLRGGLKAGQLDMTVPYRAALAQDDLQATVSNLLVRVTGLQLCGPDGDETLVDVPEFVVEGVAASLAERSARVARVHSKDAMVLARLTANGDINLLSILPAGPGTNAAPAAEPALPTAPAEKVWVAAIDEVDLGNYTIQFEDLSLPKPAKFKVDQLSLNARGLSTLTNKPIDLRLGLRVNETGTLGVQGQVCAAPQSARVEVGVTNLNLHDLQPYLDPHAKLTLVSGTFSTRVKADWLPGLDAAPQVSVTGDLEVNQLAATDQVTSAELVKWDVLRIGGIRYTMKPDRLDVDRLDWDGLKTSLLIGTDGQINLASVVPAGTNAVPADAAPAETKSASPAPFPLALGTFTLTNASFHFGDASIKPNASLAIQQFSGVIRGLSSDPDATAELDFRGSFDERSPFAVVGRINPLSPVLQVNLAISNSNLQLPAFTPYMEKFAGHPLNKGRLSLDLHYDIQGQELKSQNKFRIDQLTLGPRNDNPDAVNLPVKLGVALLKDRNGVIDLDVPVAGRLDDPQFRVSKIIFQVIGNIIVKAAASPFKLLGGLVGGGEELSFVEFVPGTAEMREGETNKVEKLVKGLLERPAINLEIEAGVDSHLDRQALALQQVRARLKAERLEELAVTGEQPDAAAFTVDPANYQRLLRAALVKEFGTNVNTALEEFLAHQAATNAIAASNRVVAVVAQAPRPKGLIPRVVSWLPIHGAKSPIGAARRQAKADAELLKQNPALAGAAGEDLELLLASRTPVDPEAFLQLMRERASVVQQALQQGGELASDRVYLVAPKAPDPAVHGLARVTMSLN